MVITNEEWTMFQVMKAIYDSDIQMDFKGSMVMKAFLMENGYEDSVRYTHDIDANWYWNVSPTASELTAALQSVLEQNNIKNDGDTTIKQISQMVHVSVTAINNAIKVLKDLTLISRVGSNKSGYWVSQG